VTAEKKAICTRVIKYLADGLDSADDAEEHEDPSEEQTESEVPLDDVRVHVYAVRQCQHFTPISLHQYTQRNHLSVDIQQTNC